MAMPRISGRTKNIANRSKKYLDEALYLRLFKEGGEDVTVRTQLNQFLKSSKRVYKWEVGDTIKKLRSRKLYYPALKLSEEMSSRGMNKTVSDQAIHLDLLAKERGIRAAEDYFIDLPDTSKSQLTYGALLNCYCKELMTEESEALFEKMKELNFGLTSMSYNSLMTLYEKSGQREKIPTIIQEMKTDNVMPDSFTYNIWMRALAASGEISGVDRVIDEMKRDGRVAADWTTYSNLASIYADAKLFDKADKALKELENLNGEKKNLSAFQFLITLYGKTGNLEEVYRMWRSLRVTFPKTANISYLNMIQVLVNLKDLAGAEKCFREWEASCSTYDIRVANVLIKAYANEGSLEKAEKLKNKAGRRGAEPNARTWEVFSEYHFKKGNMKRTVECLSNAIDVGKGDGKKWVPSDEVVASLMARFEQAGNVEGAEGFIEVLKKGGDKLGAEVFESLIRTYSVAGRTTNVMRRRLKMENVEVSEASRKLLDAISVE